jgi:hypothetical protein
LTGAFGWNASKLETVLLIEHKRQKDKMMEEALVTGVTRRGHEAESLMLW